MLCYTSFIHTHPCIQLCYHLFLPVLIWQNQVSTPSLSRYFESLHVTWGGPSDEAIPLLRSDFLMFSWGDLSFPSSNEWLLAREETILPSTDPAFLPISKPSILLIRVASYSNGGVGLVDHSAMEQVVPVYIVIVAAFIGLLWDAWPESFVNIRSTYINLLGTAISSFCPGHRD